MALAADKDGFLIGEPTVIDSGKFSRAATIWREIREDTSAIREALVDGARLAKRVATSRSATVERRKSSPTPKPSAPIPVEVVATPARARSKAAERVLAPASGAKPALPMRDARGRFLKAGSSGVAAPNSSNPDSPLSPPSSPRGGGDDDEKGSGFWRKVGGEVASAARSGIAQSAEGAESIDPSIAAAKEAGNLVAPVLKPIGALFGGAFGRNSERRKRKEAAKENAKEQHKLAVPWYKKMAGTKSVAAGGGGSGLMSFLPMILMGALGMITGPLMALGGMLAPLTKLLPVIAKLAMPLSGMFTAIQGFNTSTEDYAKRMGVELNGSLSQELGVRFVGVLGDLGNSITAGLAGKFGEYLSSKVSKASSDPTSFLNKTMNFFKGASGRKGELESAMTNAGISNASERAMLLAQAHHETGGFRSMEEGFRYSPDRLRSTSKRAAGLSASQMNALMASGESGIANFMYDGRNGNTEKGDGYKYRGRGFIQLTGKGNYAEAGKALGLDLVNNPDLAANPQIAGRIATWYYKSRNLSGAARSGDVGAVTRGINGGSNGLSDRAKLFQHYGGAPASSASGGMGVMGSAVAPSSAMVSRLSSFGAATPSVDKYTPGKAPPLLTSLGSRDKGQQTIQAIVNTPITQNVGDRQIAQVATGGMGGTGQ